MGVGMSRELLLASVAFGLFIVCPRMAGMMHVIAGSTHVSMLATVLVGTLVSIPLLLIMVFAFGRAGIWGALAFCVLTDFGAALVMKDISMRAGVETLVIALFVIVGVRVAPLVSRLLG
ncbi:MAG: hypothetical protein ACXQS1_01340 [Methermicoccaceae archaeon]